MKKIVALVLITAALLSLAACGSKDALAGTWSADLGDDGVITWTFNGKGKCTMENAYMKQNGTYTIDGDQLTVKLESWGDDASTYTFSVDGSSLTLNENTGYGISGTFAKNKPHRNTIFISHPPDFRKGKTLWITLPAA